MDDLKKVLDKKFGKNTLMKFSSDPAPYQGISTGALSLDIALGGYGFAKGRISELFGPESSGKTSLTLSTIAQCQKSGGVALFIDAEHAFDPHWAKKVGVNVDDLYIAQPSYGEEGLAIADDAIKGSCVDLVIIDSIAALTPKRELDGEMGDSHVGLQARMMSQAMRKLNGAISDSNACLILINQVREKIGVMFGSPETTPGGNAVKFYCSQRIKLLTAQAITPEGVGTKEKDKSIGVTMRATVIKNKMAPPFRKAEFELYNENGICEIGNIVSSAVDNSIIEKAGSWYSYGETKIGQGKMKCVEFLKENESTKEEIRSKILDKLGIK